jgi:hypothetical protein
MSHHEFEILASREIVFHALTTARERRCFVEAAGWLAAPGRAIGRSSVGCRAAYSVTPEAK